MHLPVDLAGDDLGLADGELEALSAHRLDEDRELQLAATLHLPGVGAVGVAHPQRDVADELLAQPLLQQPGGQLVAVTAGERGGVDPDGHAEARLVDLQDRQGARVLGVGEGLADHDLVEPGDGDQVAGPRLIGGDPFEVAGQVQLGQAHLLQTAVRARHHATGWPRRTCP